MSATGFPDAVRALIKSRAGVADNGWVRCERCGVFCEYVQLHHRRARQRGKNGRPDTNLASNGLALCMADHAWAEDQRLVAIFEGVLLRQHQSPSAVPVKLWDGWWLLDDLGGRTEAEDAA